MSNFKNFDINEVDNFFVEEMEPGKVYDLSDPLVTAHVAKMQRVTVSRKISRKRNRILGCILAVALIIFTSVTVWSFNMLSDRYDCLLEKYQELHDSLQNTSQIRDELKRIISTKVLFPTTETVKEPVEENSEIVVEEEPEAITSEDFVEDVEESEVVIDNLYSSVPLDDELKKFIIDAATEANIPPQIMFSMAWRESSFNANAKSSTNDHGLFQINEINFKVLAKEFGYSLEEFKTAIYDPYVNTECSIYILTDYRDNYNNDNWHHVLMRYNMGPGTTNKLFKQGIYSSTYSRAIIAYAEENFNFTEINIDF